EKIIERCISSVSSILGNYLKGMCISYNKDDDTAKIIEKYCKEKNIPAKIVFKTWENFRNNRNHYFKIGKEFIKEHKLDALKTYFLLLDADMVLKKRNDKDLELNLTDMAYTLSQEWGDSVYDNIRLVRGDAKVNYIKRTHEMIN